MESLIAGLYAALTPANLIGCFLGVLLGTIVGVLPGLGPAATMTIALPFTLKYGADTGLITLAGIWFGAYYGGSTTAILVNIPGEAASVVTCIDGYQLAKKGRGGATLTLVAIASFIAATIGIVGLQCFAPSLGNLALSFGPPEYFSFMLFALILLANIGAKSVHKGVLMLSLGLWWSSIGISPMDGSPRFTFGFDTLNLGIDFLPLCMGFFGIAEIFNITVRTYVPPVLIKTKIRELYPTLTEMKRSVAPALRGSILGFFFGLLPGASAVISTFVSYTLEKRLSKTPEEFGTGMIEGVVGPEAANNSAAMGAMIPLLTLGIPFSAPAAILLAGLRMHNIEAGPLLFVHSPLIFWTFIASMYIGNIMLLILNLPLVGIFARISVVKPKFLMPIVLILCLLGVYSVRNSLFDVWIMLLSGALGFFILQREYPIAPIVIGIILGPMTENNFRKSLMMFDGDLIHFFERPIAITFLFLTLSVIVYKIVSYLMRRGHSPESVTPI